MLELSDRKAECAHSQSYALVRSFAVVTAARPKLLADNLGQSSVLEGLMRY